MNAATIALRPVTHTRSFIPWLFLIFSCVLFFWLCQNDVRFALGLLVSASIVLAALESAYEGMYWGTAMFAALAMAFNPYTHFLGALSPSIFALAMIALSPMLLLFVCRKTGPYVNSLPDGSRWWLPLALSVMDVVE